MNDLRPTLLAALTLIACTLVVVFRVDSAPAARLRREATPTERAQFARLVTVEEANWIRATTENFPADRWSQRDDFHSQEARKVEAIAKKEAVRIEDVLRGVDDDIHRRNAKDDSASDGRSARAVPCKPRPFYD